MLQLDPKTITELETAGVEKLKVFFYEAGCSGNKVDMTSEFELTDDLIEILPTPNPSLTGGANSSPVRGRLGGGIKIYCPKSDYEYLKNARITKVVKADHTGKEKIRYIYSSDDVEDRCGCGTSFAFEKKKPKIDLEKLKNLKSNITIWK